MLGEILTLTRVLSGGIDASVVSIPQRPVVGRPFAIEITGAFENPCQSIGIPMAYGMEELAEGPAYVVDIETLDCSLPFSFGDFIRSQAYGTFSLDPDAPENFTLVVRTRPMGEDLPFEEFARTTVESASGNDVDKPTPGVYWNRESSGTGYSIERQGDSVFIAAFLHTLEGDPVWQTAQGRMTDGILEGAFVETRRRFPSGSIGFPVMLPTIRVGPGGFEVDLDTSEQLPMSLFSLGSAAAVLSIGDQPAPAISLERFPLAYAAGSGSLFGGEIVSLDGEWYFADVTNETQNSLGKMTLAQTDTGASLSAVFAAAESALQIVCSRQFGAATSCDLEVDGVVVAQAPRAQVSQDHIDFGAIKAWRLD